MAHSHAGHTDAVRALRVVGDRLFSGSYDGTVRAWSTATLQLERTLRCHSGPVRTLTAAGRYLFSGSYDHTVCAWSLDVSPPLPFLLPATWVVWRAPHCFPA